MATILHNLVNRNHTKQEIIEEIEPFLTLAEQIYILALQDGKTSFWNESLSASLRGCILIELSLRHRIELEPPLGRCKSIFKRKILLKNDTPLGERILDEALKLIKSSQEDISASLWLEYLNGENWNPWNWKFHLKNVKDRLGKDLAEKGILDIQKSNYFLFESITYPFRDISAKKEIIAEIHANLLHNWKGHPSRLEPRPLALILMVHAADLMENVLCELNPADYTVAQKRLKIILDCDFDKEARREPEYGVIWAVFSSFCAN